MVEYLLDTSVIRGAPKVLLESARTKGIRLIASPISIWEIFSHFEDGQIPFEQCRGWMRRAHFCNIVEHPDAELRDVLEVTPHIPPEHRTAWRERSGTLAILEMFQHASCAEDIRRSVRALGAPNTRVNASARALRCCSNL